MLSLINSSTHTKKSLNPNSVFSLWAVAIPEGPAPMMMTVGVLEYAMMLWIFGRPGPQMVLRSNMYGNESKSFVVNQELGISIVKQYSS